MQRFITLRERFHSNLIGLHVEAGYWLTDERLRSLTGGVGAIPPGWTRRSSAPLRCSADRSDNRPIHSPTWTALYSTPGGGMIALNACLKQMEILFIRHHLRRQAADRSLADENQGSQNNRT